MAKAIEGAALIAGTLAVFAVAPYLAPAALAFIVSTAGSSLLVGAGLTGVGMEVTAIGDALRAGPITPVTTRQSAQPYRIVYGMARVGGSLCFESTSGHQLNHVWIWAAHQCQSVDRIFLDHKEIFYNGALGPNWGSSNGTTYRNEEGNAYNFGGLVYVEHRYGYPGQLVRDSSGVNAPTNWIQGLTANDPAWSSNHNCFGLCYSYVKCTASASQFPAGQPQVKATIRGKNDILDPRTNTRGYTTNAALCVADFLTNQDFGMGMSWDEIDTAELIASANVCDEQVLLKNGLYEYRYTCNGTFTTDASRGDILHSLLDSMAGRLAFVGGQHKIIAGYDRGVSLHFAENDFTGDIQWSSRRSFRGLFNEVQAVFTCPRYPYGAVGNLYNHDLRQPGTFDGSWQPTSAPPYSLSSARGYTQYPLTDFEGHPILDGSGIQALGDSYMAEDNGVRLRTDLKLQFVLSVAQSQRLARIHLLRHRQQGSGTLPLKLSGLQTCALDNILVSYSAFGWANKEVEVAGWRLVPKQVEDSKSILFETEVDVVDTDPAAAYAWSTADELAMNQPVDLAIQDSAQVENPTSLALESGADSQVVTSDGISHPRIRVTWTAPLDPLITSGGMIQVQYQGDGDAWWLHAAPVTGDTAICFIPGVVQGHGYNVRIRAVKNNGAEGAWVPAGPHVVSNTLSVITTGSLNPNSPVNSANNATISSAYVTFANGTSDIRIYVQGPGSTPGSYSGQTWTLYMGRAQIVCPSANVTGLQASTKYYVCLNPVTGIYSVKSFYTDTLDDTLYYIGTVTTVASGGTGGLTGGGGRQIVPFP